MLRKFLSFNFIEKLGIVLVVVMYSSVQWGIVKVSRTTQWRKVGYSAV